MQSQRKNSGSYFSKQQSTLIHSSKSNSSHKKRLSVATQTENYPDFGKVSRLCNFTSMSMDEIRENYSSTLSFLNCCHDFINKIFGENCNKVEDSKLEKPFRFQVPEVPNYFSVLELFLERSRENLVGAKRGKDEEFGDEEIIFDLKRFLPKNIGDGPSSLKSPRGVTRNRGAENINNHSMFKNNENVSGLKSFGAKKRRSTSPSRLVKSEKDIPKRPSGHEITSLSTTFEEILKACKEFEGASKEQLFKEDIPLDFNQHSLGNLVLRKYEQGDQKNQRKTPPIIMEDSFQLSRPENDTMSRETTSDSKKNARDNFNLIEYALNNLKDSEYDSDSPPLSPKSRAPQLHQDQVNMFPSQGLLTQNLPDMYDMYNFQDISLTNQKSFTVLNAAHQSQVPKKVNELFQKISTGNMRSSSKAGSSCDFNDSETFIKFLDNDTSPDEYGTEYLSKVFIENCEETGDLKRPSSSDSIILTDEEFERKNRNSCVVWSKEKVCAGKERRSNDGKYTRDQSLENGDFRPGVISILEEKQRASFTQNSAKNVQFRTERKFDVKVQYNVNSKTVDEERKSKSKSSVEQQRGSNTSLHSSTVTCSSSTVSDSDLLSMDPNIDQTLIKKF